MQRSGELVDLVHGEEAGGVGDQLAGVLVTVPGRDAQAAPAGAVT
jgi:hypothetical protein